MRIVLLDTIQEQHVADSLARALRGLGHDVHATGPVWHGWRLPTSAADRRMVREVVEAVLRRRPDVVLVLRPATLHPDELKRLQSAGIRTVAWFSDDPVLFKVQGRLVAPHYDLTLHTAMAPVLELYERELGVRGWGFPFWTDQRSFPRLYDPVVCDLDLVFIGNTQTRVKHWRYDWVAALPHRVAIYGQVQDDIAGIHAGVAVDDAALALASTRGRFGLNISQRFADYAGHRFDYPELADFGEFPLPSRIVQLAAVGTPVVSLVAGEQGRADLARLFPPVVTVSDAAELDQVIAAHSDADLARLSARTHEWFARHYTAAARARFLEALLKRSTTPADADTRATAFLQYTTPGSWERRTAKVRTVVRTAPRALAFEGRRVIAGVQRRLRWR